MLSSQYFSSNTDLINAANNRSPLKNGSRGEAVRRLQVALSTRGFPMPKSMRPQGGFDSIFGKEVYGTVLKIQKRHGLKVDGVCGRQTHSLIDRDLSAVETKLHTIGAAISPLLARGGKTLNPTPDNLRLGVDLPVVTELNTSTQQIMGAWAKLTRSLNEPVRVSQTLRPGATRALYTGPVGGQVQFAAAPLLAAPAAALAALAALEQAILACIALLLIIALLWGLTKIIPALVDGIIDLWNAAMAEVGAAANALNDIIRTSIEAFGRCGHFLLELAKILKNIVARGQSPVATKNIRTNAKSLKIVPNENVLEGMRGLVQRAAEVLAQLMACMHQNELLSTEAFRKLEKWMKEFRELEGKLKNFKRPIGPLW